MNICQRVVMNRWLLLTMLGLIGCTPKSELQAPRPSRVDAGLGLKEAVPDNVGLQSQDLYYGVYLNGHKVGWMRSQLVQAKGEALFTTNLEARVGGLGTISTVTLTERRVFDQATGELLRLSFEQSASTGSVKVWGVVNQGGIDVSVLAGEEETSHRVKLSENLDDALAIRQLAREATVGAERTALRFDPSVIRTIGVNHRVEATETRVLSGVETKTVRVLTRYPELKVEEATWLDEQGRVLEARVGQFFVVRLEPELVAKKLDYEQDLLISAVVQSPKAIVDAASIEKLNLAFSGFGDQVPPESPRQAVTKDGETTHLRLTRDQAMPIVPMPKVRGQGPYLEATPFIQADSPVMLKAAKEAVGDAAFQAEAIQRLVEFVYHKIEDEYVPAYSNALEVLRTKRGDCTEHSVLMVALARALGIPARVAVGIAYWPPGGGFGWHAWTEVLIDSQWYAVDPTWNQVVADATHVKLADGGPVEQARIVMLLGNLKIDTLTL